MTKKSFEAEIMSGMQHELTKNVCAEKPNLSKAAECLHAALEILEAQGLQARADQVLDLIRENCRFQTRRVSTVTIGQSTNV